jgi:chromosome segregation ATPase
VNDVPVPRPQSPSVPTSPPITITVNNNHKDALSKAKDENARLSHQIEVLLGQLEAQNTLSAANAALRVENDIYRSQVKDTEKMMADILAVHESESAASLEKHTQELSRLVGALAEKDAQCEELERRLRALSEEEREVRTKLREADAAMARGIADAQGDRQTIEAQRQQIADLSARVGDMSTALANEPESARQGTTSNRELRVLIRDVTRENEGLKSEVRDMQRAMEQLLLSTKHARHDEMEVENRRLKQSVAELENMLAQLHTSLGLPSPPASSPFSSPADTARSHTAAAALARENEQLKAQLHDGRRAFADFRSASETRVVELQQKVEELVRENNRLKIDMHEANEGPREDGSVPPPAYDDAYVPAE